MSRAWILVFWAIACANPAAADMPPPPPPVPEATPAPQGETTLEAAFPVPAGAMRVPTAGFGAWLRILPLYAADRAVMTYDGGVVRMPAARVVKIPLVPGDLQHCSDSILRLRATWERSDGRDPAFRYTSGDLSKWADWRAGTRLVVSGNRVTRVPGKAAPDASDASFEAYLTDLFTYAGTRSLPTDTTPTTGPVQPGDLLVTPGSPGHAVLILDVATRGADTWVLVGQGYMPAMDFHVFAGDADGWVHLDGRDGLPTRPIPMSWASRRRFL